MQPNSGSQANQAVFFGLLQPGDTIMGMSLAEGGHLTHGMPLNMSGKWFKVVSYGLDANEAIDYDAMERLAHEHKPKLIIAGASAYSLRIDFERFAKVAKAIGAYLHGRHGALRRPDRRRRLPEPGAARRRGDLHHPQEPARPARRHHPDEGRSVAKKINSAIFPGIQGGPLMHVIAAKAVAFKEALAPEFKAYQQQVVKNAVVLAETLIERGLRIVSGRTESHVMLVDLRPKGLTGKEAEAVLGAAHMTCNKNGIPNDPQKPMVTSGIRLGTPAMTTRGFGEEQARADRAPDRRRARQAARRGQHRRGARQGGGADARLPGLPLSGRRPEPPCAARSAATTKPRSSRRASPTKATSCAGAAAASSCDKRFTTYERAEIALPAVVKKDGTRADFDPAKLRASMTLALRKRPVSVEQIDAALERIQDKLLNSGAREVPSHAPRRAGDARAEAHRQGGLRALRVGLPQLRGRRRVPPADPRHLSAAPDGASPRTAPGAPARGAPRDCLASHLHGVAQTARDFYSVCIGSTDEAHMNNHRTRTPTRRHADRSGGRADVIGVDRHRGRRPACRACIDARRLDGVGDAARHRPPVRAHRGGRAQPAGAHQLLSPTPTAAATCPHRRRRAVQPAPRAGPAACSGGAGADQDRRACRRAERVSVQANVASIAVRPAARHQHADRHRCASSARQAARSTTSSTSWAACAPARRRPCPATAPADPRRSPCKSPALRRRTPASR